MSSEKKSAFGGGLFGKESTNYEVYLNLTPLMDVMSNILFFLLAAFGTSVLAILPATVPVASFEESSIEKETDRVTVTVRADNAGIAVRCESTTLTPDELRPFEAQLPKRQGDFDHEGLTAALKRIKERFPGSKTMILVPADRLSYQQVVRLMDAARAQKREGGVQLTLFPDVVLSGIAPVEGKPKAGRK